MILYRPDFERPGTGAASLAIEAFSRGLTRLGVAHELRETEDYRGDIADVAVVCGWTKAMLWGCGRKTRNDVIAAQAEAIKPAWCLERGFLLDRGAWSSLSIGGFCATGGDFRAEWMPPDRWASMGLDLAPWRTDGDYVLLCAQVPWDAQVDDGNHLEWIESTIREIRKNTDLPIRFRGHPKAWRQRNPYHGLSREALATCGITRVDPPMRSFEDDLEAAACVVCYNSNVAVLSVVAGVPVFVSGHGLAREVANHDLAMIDRPLLFDRDQWAWDLAYKQWHVSEFEEGLPWLHLTRP